MPVTIDNYLSNEEGSVQKLELKRADDLIPPLNKKLCP